MKFKIELIFLALLCFSFISCTPQMSNYISIDGENYIDVKSVGVKGNGTFDDTKAIQSAIDNFEKLYFPKGQYLLKSKISTTALLKISEISKARGLLFEDGSIVKVSENQPKDYIKPAVLLIIANKGNVGTVIIDGMSIEGNREMHSIKNPGIVAYEKQNYAIRKLVLKNISIKNTGGGGIHTQARFNDFNNIKTENCGSHGIGIVNSTNPGVINEFYLDGFTSINDDAYSIDFSGYKDPNNVGHAFLGYAWKGSAKNIVSKNSYYGIKTAGYWNLELENVRIENSAHNGFFINVDAPNTNINVKNITIENAKGNGLQLQGKTNFNASDVEIIGCKVGININRTNVSISGLLVDGKNRNIAGILMGKGKVQISNFVIQNNSKKVEYPIWVNGTNVTLENGRFIDNNSPHEIIIKENAGNVKIENVSFEYNISNVLKKTAILNIQKGGLTEIINCEYDKIYKKQIADRTKTIRIKNNKQ